MDKYILFINNLQKYSV